MAHKFAKGKWNPVPPICKHPGSETKRAQEHGRSLHEQERSRFPFPQQANPRQGHLLA